MVTSPPQTNEPVVVRADAAAASAPPGWFDRLTVAAATLTLVAGACSLGAAALGALNWVTGLVCVLLAAGAALLVARRMPARPAPTQAATIGALCAVGIVVVAGVWASWNSSEHLLVDRDPGSYATTAKWISSGNGLGVDDPLGAFGDNTQITADGVAADSNAVFAVGEDLEFQFMHLPAALPALAGTLAGDHTLLLVNGLVAALGLMAIYSVTVRITSRPLMSLLAPAALAVSMPFVAVTRDIYSEPFVLLFLWTAILCMSEATRHPDRRVLGALAGLLLGATVAARVDGVPNLVFGVFLATVWVVAATNDERHRRARTARAGLRAAGLVALIGTLDLVVNSRSYATLLRTNLLMLWGLLALMALVCWFGYMNRIAIERLARRATQYSAVAVTAAATVGLALFALWILRPRLQTARSADPTWFRLAEWQAAEGMPVDATRTFVESSMAWMGWYLGVPTLAAAVLTLVWATWRILRGRAAPELVMVTVVTLGTGLMYWWRPSITPDQIWATRRFLPVVLPGLAVMAAVGAARLLDHGTGGYHKTRGYRRAVVGTALSAVMLVPPLLVTLDAPLMREQHGMLVVVERTCELLGDDSAVLVIGEPDSRVLPQTLRSWCGVPVAAVDDGSAPLSAQDLDSLAAHTEARGYDLEVVTSDVAALDALGLQWSVGERTRSASSTRRLEHTVGRAPSRYLTDDETVTVPSDYSLVVADVPVP